MEDHSSAPVSKGKSSILRYPLRSATKSKEEKPPVAELSNSSVSKRGRPVSTVSKSVSVLDYSGKDKSGKPPRRSSISAKTAVSPVPRSFGNITPVSEARAKWSGNSQAKNDSPISDVSRSSSRRTFNVMSSASYWLSQIKLSESAAKHNISLGLFKLALEAGCEPLQRMRNELKAYARRHDLAEFGGSAKQLFESYDILENLELRASENITQIFEEGARSSDDDVHSSSSVSGARKLKPKSLGIDATSAKASPAAAKSGKKNATPMDNSVPPNRKSSNSINGFKNVRCSISKKSQKPAQKKFNVEKCKTQKQGKEVSPEQGPTKLPVDEPLQENKENMDSPPMEETNMIEV